MPLWRRLRPSPRHSFAPLVPRSNALIENRKVPSDTSDARRKQSDAVRAHTYISIISKEMYKLSARARALVRVILSRDERYFTALFPERRYERTSDSSSRKRTYVTSRITRVVRGKRRGRCARTRACTPIYECEHDYTNGVRLNVYCLLRGLSRLVRSLRTRLGRASRFQLTLCQRISRRRGMIASRRSTSKYFRSIFMQNARRSAPSRRLFFPRDVGNMVIKIDPCFPSNLSKQLTCKQHDTVALAPRLYRSP